VNIAAIPGGERRLSPFRFRNFRLQYAADLITSWAFEMEALVLGWYMLVETNSVLLLTLYAALVFLGTFLSPLIGVLGDRSGHQRVLGTLRLCYTVFAAVVMGLAFAGLLSPLAVLLVAALFGLLRPSDPGLRFALVSMTMPEKMFVGAMSYLRTTMDLARITGALTGAAIFVVLGLGPAYVVIVLLYATAAALTLLVRPPAVAAAAAQAPPIAEVEPSLWRELKEGFVYAWDTPLTRALIWIAFLINFTAFPLTNGLMPYAAREVFHTDQTGLSYLVASFAAGSLVGSLILNRMQNGRLGRLIIVTTILWHVLLLAFVYMPNLPAAMTCLALAGMFQSICAVALSVILMRTASERMRGRVMGVRMLVVYSLPVGLLLAGALVERIGYIPTVTTYIMTGVVLMAVIGVRWRNELWRKQAPANL
jgi:MFS family permease